jgi:hypothetical protein
MYPARGRETNTGGDKGQVDGRLQPRAELHLGSLGGLMSSSLQCGLVCSPARRGWPAPGTCRISRAWPRTMATAKPGGTVPAFVCALFRCLLHHSGRPQRRKSPRGGETQHTSASQSTISRNGGPPPLTIYAFLGGHPGGLCVLPLPRNRPIQLILCCELKYTSEYPLPPVAGPVGTGRRPLSHTETVRQAGARGTLIPDADNAAVEESPLGSRDPKCTRSARRRRLGQRPPARPA